jgi:hypothetical protein
MDRADKMDSTTQINLTTALLQRLLIAHPSRTKQLATPSIAMMDITAVMDMDSRVASSCNSPQMYTSHSGRFMIPQQDRHREKVITL